MESSVFLKLTVFLESLWVSNSKHADDINTVSVYDVWVSARRQMLKDRSNYLEYSCSNELITSTCGSGFLISQCEGLRIL